MISGKMEEHLGDKQHNEEYLDYLISTIMYAAGQIAHDLTIDMGDQTMFMLPVGIVPSEEISKSASVIKNRIYRFAHKAGLTTDMTNGLTIFRPIRPDRYRSVRRYHLFQGHTHRGTICSPR